jgi:hypothetical protein
MPHPGHFICSRDCGFVLNTKVSNYIVSTVGEYFPDAEVRELFAKSRGIKLTGIGDARRNDYMERIGFEEIGFGRKYETMVFKAKPNPEHRCCPWSAESFSEIDMNGYNDPGDAYDGHMAMCDKWGSE